MKWKKWLPLLQGHSGKVGNKVFYQRNGKTFIRKAQGSHNIIPTPLQAVARERFRQAHLFAQGIISDPVLKAVYQKRAKPMNSAYNVAVAEYMNAGG